MKRPIVIVAMTYVAGLLAGAILHLPPLLTLAVIALIAVSQIVLRLRGRAAVDMLLYAAVVLIGVFQQNRIAAENRAAREQIAWLEKQQAVRMEGRLAAVDRVFARRGVFRIEGCVIRSEDGATWRFPAAIQLACSDAAWDSLREHPPARGDRVVAEGRIWPPPDLANPDVLNYRAYLEQHGIGAVMDARRAESVAFSPPTGWRSPLDWAVGSAFRIRQAIDRTYEKRLDREAFALNRSIFLGDTDRLDRGVREDFTRCGLAHVFAVSGMNVVMLAWVLDALIRLFRPRPKWRSAALIAAIAVYCAVVGFQPSVMRAAFMFAALLALPFVRYRIESLTALAAAALVILAADPRVLRQPGFQLSFLCMVSVVLLKPPLDRWWTLDAERGSPRRQRLAAFFNHRILPDLTMLVAAQAGVLPFLAAYYHRIPFLGFVSNLAAAPLVWLIMATNTVLLGCAAIATPVAPVFAAALNWFNHLLLDLVGFWAGLPGVSIFMPDWPAVITVLYYLVLFGWAVLPLAPSPFFEARQRARLLLVFAMIAAWLIWAPAVFQRSAAGLRATFLDVGQGDSCVLELPGGAVILVDGGDISTRAGERIIAPFLESRGIEYLDAVIVTHPDADHVGGLPAVFNELAVGELIEGPAPGSSLVYGQLNDAATNEAARRDTVFAGDWIEGSMGARVSFLHPQRGAAYPHANDLSLVMLASWGAHRILIAGDVEKAGERDLLASGATLQATVLKVAHHGSANATSAEFLKRARPELAVISCGRGNPFGHPSPDVLKRLADTSATVVRTDEAGAVTVRCERLTFSWRCEKSP